MALGFECVGGGLDDSQKSCLKTSNELEASINNNGLPIIGQMAS